MTPEETLALFNQGKEAWNKWAREALDANNTLPAVANQDKKTGALSFMLMDNTASAKFSNHTFEENTSFSDYIFPSDCRFSNCKFPANVSFSKCEAHRIFHFERCVFSGDCDLSSANLLGNTDIENGTIFEGRLIINDATFNSRFSITNSRCLGGITLTGCTFKGELNVDNTECRGESYFLNASKPMSTKINSSKFDNVTFSRFDLRDADFSRSDLSGSRLSGNNLSGANFTECALDGAELLQCRMDTSTRFDKATVSGTSINKYSLDFLDNYGGLSVGSRMGMIIEDDIASLRRNYSGFSRWVHLGALIAFLFPYVWFLAKRWSEARFFGEPDETSISLLTAVLRFIYNGGKNWEAGFIFHWSFLVFILSLLFNAGRATLLWKTRQIEFEEEVRGVPSEFSIYDPIIPRYNYIFTSWSDLEKFVKFTSWAFILLAIANSLHFLMMRISISP